jgi:lipoate-protein ligase A
MMRLVHDDPLTGARNMAIDEALMESARRGVTTVRFYGWQPGCLSFGRNQAAAGHYDADAATARGIDIVRRPTGGRAVYHHRELTYSVTAPADTWGSLRDAYCRINRALATGLQALGAPVACAGERTRGAAPRPTARACFRDPLPGEVTAEGRKLIGSAQWRVGGALLQHGSLLLVNEQRVTEELRISSRGSGSASRSDAHTGAIGLGDVMGTVPLMADLVAGLRSGFEIEFGTSIEAGSLDETEREAVGALVENYTDPAWTWRR